MSAGEPIDGVVAPGEAAGYRIVGEDWDDQALVIEAPERGWVELRISNGRNLRGDSFAMLSEGEELARWQNRRGEWLALEVVKLDEEDGA